MNKLLLVLVVVGMFSCNNKTTKVKYLEEQALSETRSVGDQFMSEYGDGRLDKMAKDIVNITTKDSVDIRYSEIMPQYRLKSNIEGENLNQILVDEGMFCFFAYVNEKPIAKYIFWKTKFDKEACEAALARGDKYSQFNISSIDLDQPNAMKFYERYLMAKKSFENIFAIETCPCSYGGIDGDKTKYIGEDLSIKTLN